VDRRLRKSCEQFKNVARTKRSGDWATEARVIPGFKKKSVNWRVDDTATTYQKYKSKAYSKPSHSASVNSPQKLEYPNATVWDW
jgi:hypothetical protein